MLGSRGDRGRPALGGDLPGRPSWQGGPGVGRTGNLRGSRKEGPGDYQHTVQFPFFYTQTPPPPGEGG